MLRDAKLAALDTLNTKIVAACETNPTSYEDLQVVKANLAAEVENATTVESVHAIVDTFDSEIMNAI